MTRIVSTRAEFEQYVRLTTVGGWWPRPVRVPLGCEASGAIVPVRMRNDGPYPAFRYSIGPWCIDLHVDPGELLWDGSVLLRHPLSNVPVPVDAFDACRRLEILGLEQLDDESQVEAVVAELTGRGLGEADDTVREMLDSGLTLHDFVVRRQVSLTHYEKRFESVEVPAVREHLRVEAAVLALGDVSDPEVRDVIVSLFPTWRVGIEELVAAARDLVNG